MTDEFVDNITSLTSGSSKTLLLDGRYRCRLVSDNAGLGQKCKCCFSALERYDCCPTLSQQAHCYIVDTSSSQDRRQSQYAMLCHNVNLDLKNKHTFFLMLDNGKSLLPIKKIEIV